MSNPDPLLAADAPIVALMSLTGNPLLKDMSTEELVAHLQRVKSLEKQAPTLLSQLNTEAVKAGRGTSQAAKRKSLLDSI